MRLRTNILSAAIGVAAISAVVAGQASAKTIPCPRGNGILHHGRLRDDRDGTRVVGLTAIDVLPRIAQGGGAPPQEPCTAAGGVAGFILYSLDDRKPPSFPPVVGIDPDGERWLVHYTGNRPSLSQSSRIKVIARHGRHERVTMTLLR
jgi:hypothetical protein